MKDFILLFINPRFWSAYIGLTFPIWGCLIAGFYVLAKERVLEWIEKEAKK